MRGGDGGIEDRAEEGASVGHRLASRDLRWKHATPVIHPFPAKENPRSDAAGAVESQVARSRLCGAA